MLPNIDQGSIISEAAEKAGISRMTLYRKANSNI
ncbi:helix-turn-helix domain-containing protein [Bacillus sp. DX1.1]|nr:MULTISPECIES: helix-turn-helix domain-containing protein [unclassified Bacillus (in: firmicutes)]MDM5155580.1 helix-turn-helix domain-containing protein [Bacillus sp. DX1.1]WJE79887.1 helix-turn-helix domain-containing protein [Bacillus sp. DX3.1]